MASILVYMFAPHTTITAIAGFFCLALFALLGGLDHITSLFFKHKRMAL
jgi:hypothetical protein